MCALRVPTFGTMLPEDPGGTVSLSMAWAALFDGGCVRCLSSCFGSCSGFWLRQNLCHWWSSWCFFSGLRCTCTHGIASTEPESNRSPRRAYQDHSPRCGRFGLCAWWPWYRRSNAGLNWACSYVWWPYGALAFQFSESLQEIRCPLGLPSFRQSYFPL